MSHLDTFFPSLTVTLSLGAALATPARADSTAPTTQACLGELTKFLTCPAGATVAGSECRQREPQRGAGTGEHWSGSKRQGPALFLRSDSKAKDAPLSQASRVRFAATYRDHKKTGRVFHFDKDGRLESWDNRIDDQYVGLMVSCTPDGHVSHLASYLGGKVIGVSRAWSRKDGTLTYAIDHDPNGKSLGSVTVAPELARRPDELCHPATCDVTAKPDVSGLPKGVTLPTR